MASGSSEIGKYILPVMPSLEGVGAEIDRQAGRAFGSLQKQASQALAGGVRDGVAEAEAAVKKSSEAIAKLRDKEAAAADKLRVAEERINEVREKGGSSLARAEAQRNAALRAQRSALSDIEAQTRSLERAQQRVNDAQSEMATGGLRGVGASALSAGSAAAEGFLDGFGGPIAALGTKGGPVGMALAGLGLVGFGAGAAIGQQVLAGLEREVASDRLAGQLGLTPAEAAEFGDIAGRAYGANFGESMGDVNDALAAVSSTLGKDSPALVLEDMTTKALTFRDTFGTEVAESIATVQSLIANGLAPDSAAAFDAMVTAYQRVPAAMRDELPDILSEYATFGDSLGLSMEDVFGLIVKNAPRGQIAIDKIGDSLKEFQLLATDLGAKPVQDTLAGLGLNGAEVANNLLARGATAKAQFGQIVDGLLAIPDAGQQAAAAVALFGTPLEDLDKAKIPEFLNGLDAADQAMQGFAGSAKKLVEDTSDNAAGALESARRAVELGTGKMQESLALAFGPHVEQFAKLIVDNQDTIVHGFQWIAGGATEMAAGIGYAVGGAVTAFGGLVEATSDTSGWIIDGLEGMVGAAATVADALGQDGLAADLRGAQGTLGGFSDTLHGAGEGITDTGLAILGTSERLRTFDGSMAQSATSAQNAATQIAGVKTAMEQLPGGKQIDINAVVVFRDQAGRPIDPAQLFTSQRQMDAAGVGAPSRGWWPSMARPSSDLFPTPSPTGGAGSTIGAPEQLLLPPPQWTPPAPTTSGSSGGGGGRSADAPAQYFDPSLWQVDPGATPAQFSDANLVPNAARLNDLIAQQFPQITDIGGYRANGGGSNDHPSGQALDIMIPEWDTPAGKALGDQINQFLHANAQALGVDSTIWQDFWAPVGGDGHRLGRQGANEGHYNHIHAKVQPGPAAGGPLVGVGGYGMPQPDFDPVGTGGYVVDPQAVFDAESAVLQERNELEQKRLKLLELEATGNATQSQLLAARNDIAEQTRALQSAEMKRAEAQRGKLAKAGATGGAGAAAGGGSELGELGSIAGSFLKETFGLDGTLFPDPSQLGIVKIVDAILGIGFTPQDSAAAGGYPFAPAGAPGAGGGGTSGLPFGMIPAAIDAAGVAQPGMAAPGSPASGFGLGAPPGPVDNSRNVSVQVDSGPSSTEIGNVVRREIASVDRLITHTGPGIG